MLRPITVLVATPGVLTVFCPIGMLVIEIFAFNPFVWLIDTRREGVVSPPCERKVTAYPYVPTARFPPACTSNDRLGAAGGLKYDPKPCKGYNTRSIHQTRYDAFHGTG